eukprot:CCRYP_003110-RA/>CCRYP_003110-RA protein AED:0.09 eAED:0.09 QI:0/0/0/1/1/1/2/0/574
MMLAIPKPLRNSDRYQPAYEGAKFDKSGYCLKHPMIRLCTPAGIGEPGSLSLLSNNEEEEKIKPQFKYVIIRKICPMCGEHSLRNERKFNKGSWAHGYQQPGLIERQSCRGYVAAHSTKRRVDYHHSSDTSSVTESPPSSPEVSRGNSSPNSLHYSLNSSEFSGLGRRTKNLEDLFAITGNKIPVPPVRDSFPLRDCDVLVDKCTRARDVSATRKRLEGKVPFADPNSSKGREKILSKSTLRKDDHYNSVPCLIVESTERLSRGRIITSRGNSTRRESHSASDPSLLDKSSRLERHRSSSRHSRPLEVQARSSKSVATRSTNKSFSHKHSTQPASSKSMCIMTFSRRGSVPVVSSNTTSVNYRKDSDAGNTKRETAMKRSSSKHSLNHMSESTSSMTSSWGDSDTRIQSGGSFHSLSRRGRSESKSKLRLKHAEEKSIYSRERSKSKHNDSKRHTEEKSTCSRGRRKSKPRRKASTEDQKGNKSVISSARRPFSNSLRRRRSLSSKASRVMKTTSTMDGDRDAEPCMQRYELPFNPATGGCNYHPEISLAVRNGGRRGGWRIIRDSCPKCSNLN